MEERRSELKKKEGRSRREADSMVNGQIVGGEKGRSG
jgi:hypothetical protein